MPAFTFDDAETSQPVPQTQKCGRVNDGLVLGEILAQHNKDHAEHATPVLLGASAHDNIKAKGGSWWKARDTFVLLTFLGVTFLYMVQVSLSIAIVAMVSKNETASTSQVSDTCPVSDDNSGYTVIVGDFDWSDNTVALVLGALYLGCTLTNFLGGRAAENFGARLIFGLGIVVPSILSFLSPLCSYASEYAFFALRMLQGMALGVSVPSMHVLIAAWIPPKDKAKYFSVILSGTQVGTVTAMSFGGWLCNTTFLGGWPSVFYVFGGLGVLWGVPWFFLIHNLPEHNPRISSSELEYILTHRHYVKRDKAMPIPWRDIATSMPFWAIIGASFCYSLSFYTILSELPTFFSIILHFDMNKNALGSAVPYILQGVINVGWSYFVDLLHSRNYMTVIGIRKLSTAIAHCVSMEQGLLHFCRCQCVVLHRLYDLCL